MNKKVFIKNKPFDVNDANDMQNWTEDALKKTMASIYSSGIVSGLNVVPKTGLQLTLNIGTAFNSNYDFINLTTTQTLTLGTAHATLGRYDKVVISYLQSTADNIDTANTYGMGTSYLYSQNKLDSYTVQVIAGTPASSPTVPATPVGSLALAQIYVGPAASTITAGNITDLRQYTTLNANINKPLVVISNTAPADTNVLWIDTTVNKPKIYVSNAWIILKASDADTLGGNAPSYYSPATHNHDSTYAKIGDAYTKTESDTNFLKKTDNLAALTDKATARTNLGLGSMATQSTASFSPSTHNHDGTYVKGDYVLAVSSTAPTSDTKTIWWDTAANLIKRYNGTAWVSLNATDAETVSGYSVGTGANNILKLDSGAKVPNANLNNSSTSGAGIVQLTDSYTSTSTTTAATANSAKLAYDNAISFVKGFGIGSNAVDKTSVDLNTIIGKTGFYRGSSLTNSPSGVTQGYILNINYTSNYDLQIFWSISTGLTYNRVNNNGVWSAWKQQATTDLGTTSSAGIIQLTDSYQSTSTTTAATANSAKMAYDNAVTWAKGFGLGDVAKDISSTDLNALDVTGFYRGGSLTNSPNSAQTYYIIHLKHSTAYRLQIACHIGTNAILTRINNNGTWTAWSQLATTDVATTSADGLMSSTDKSKLNGIASGAEVNQNAFATVKVGATSIVADAESDILEIAGTSPITLTPDATNDKVTIAVNDGTTGAKGVVQLTDSYTSTSITTAATANSAKLAYDNAVAWAKNYGLGTRAYSFTADLNTLASESGFYYSNATGDLNRPTQSNGWVLVQVLSANVWATQMFVAAGNGNVFTRSLLNNTWTAWKQIATTDVVTTSANGLMSSTDKSKLDGIEPGAQVNQNAYSMIKVGPATLLAGNTSDTFELIAGSGINLISDTSFDTVTITNAGQQFKLTNDDGTIKIAVSLITDLNMLQTPGQWYIGTSQSSNKPSGITYGLLEVFKNSSEILQRFTEMGSVSNGRQFFRQYTGSAWTPWVAIVTDQSPTWTNMSLQNSWVAYGGSDPTPQYTRIGNKVRFKGTIKGGTTAAGTTLFTLPSGYRPAQRIIVPVTTAGGTNDMIWLRIFIEATGSVVLNSSWASSTWISLDNIEFIADGS